MKTIAVFFGGRSTEHDVSIITGLASVIKPLESLKKYKVEAIYISKDGSWYWDDRLKDIALYRSGDIKNFLHKNQPASVQFDGGMTLVKSSGIAGRKKSQKIDVAFPAMHGTFGEDGSLMGLLRMSGIPFVGCDIDSSVLSMDKVLSKQIVESNDIPVTKYIYLYRETFIRNSQAIVEDILKSLKFPLFIKPAHLGSSIGVSRATSIRELENSIEVACHYDDKVLVEEEVPNLIEVTLPILGTEPLKPAMLERPLTKPDEYFDFETKYMQGGKKGSNKSSIKGVQGYSEVPAKLDKALYKQAEELGKKSFKTLGCSGIARVDMLIDSKLNKVYFNEVNPLPGGLYSHNWRVAGVSNQELISTLIRLAEERWQNRQQQNTVFMTNYLQQF